MSKPHNGYSNYATWRVQLEILDGIEWESPVNADDLELIVEEIVFDNAVEKDCLAAGFARSFLGDVNYYELERMINEELEENKTDYQKRRENENN